MMMTVYQKSVLGLLIIVVFVSGLYVFTPLPSVPSLHLPLIDGRTLALTSLKGRPTLVYFWASTCATCVEEIPQLIRLYRDFSSQRLEIVGIAMFYDPPNRVVHIANGFEIPYPIALDVQGQAAEAFGGIAVTPMHFLISAQGEIVYQHHGRLDEPRIRRYLAEK